jgi:hypothetical protein
MLLSVWEKGQNRHVIDLALLLHSLAEPDEEPNSLADKPLGERNAALIRLREATFGRTMHAYTDCPECGLRLEFELDSAELLAMRPYEMTPIVAGGYAFRPPTDRDLAAILAEETDEDAALKLLRLCAVDTDEFVAEIDLESLLDTVETAIEGADPLTEIMLDLHCQACGHERKAILDIVDFLWEEINAYATRLLDDIHILASAYGWSESTILSLSDVRRAAYLERVSE